MLLSELQRFIEETGRECKVDRQRFRRESPVMINGKLSQNADYIHEVRICNLYNRKGSEEQWICLEPMAGESTVPDPHMYVKCRYSAKTKKRDWSYKTISTADMYLTSEIEKINNRK